MTSTRVNPTWVYCKCCGEKKIWWDRKYKKYPSLYCLDCKKKYGVKDDDEEEDYEVKPRYGREKVKS